jgi:hypothetical protein
MGRLAASFSEADKIKLHRRRNPHAEETSN